MQLSRWENLWRSRRTPWLLLILLVALAAIALWVFLDYQRTVAALAVKAEYNVTRLTAARIREELADFPTALMQLARSSDILSEDPDLQAQALQRELLIQEGLFDGGLVVLNNFGTVVAAEPPRLEIMRQDWSARPYFRGLLSRSATSVAFSNAVNEGPGGSQVIVVSVPIIDGEDRFVGVLAGMLRLSQSTISPYYATLVKMRVSPDGTAYLIDGSRKILFDSASQRNGEQYTNLPASAAPAAVEALRTTDAAGREILVAHAPIPGTPWTLVTEKDWETLIAPVKAQSNLLLVLLGLAAILPLAILILLERQRRDPLAWDDPIQRESHLAHQIDRALLPEQAPTLPGWEIAVHCEPGLVAGRVFYDTVLGLDGCLTLMVSETNMRNGIGDSVPAVLAIVGVRTLLRSSARSMLRPAEALERTNRALCPDVAPGDFVACLYSRLDPASGAAQIGNAGQIRPLKVAKRASAAANSVEIVGGQDPPLGLHLECGYGEFPCVLAPGDFLFLYSSGVVDARNADGEPFGFARLERALTTQVEEGARRIQAVTDAIREFAGGAWAGDRDAILIVVERMQGGAAAAEMQEA